MKLPSTVKHLLKLRGPNPPQLPPLPQLNGVLKSTLLDAKQKNAETAWLVLTVRQGDPRFHPLDGRSSGVYLSDLHSVDREPPGICQTSLLFRDQERSGRCRNEAWHRTGGQYRSVDA